MHRGNVFEDPLDDFLQNNDLGNTSGGGTLLDREGSGEILECDVEIEIKDFSAETIARIVGELKRLGTPKGSRLSQRCRVVQIA
jgi:hypothetical protein